jgi:Zn finger protein HypA/HybF involved in hydrogenase expression
MCNFCKEFDFGSTSYERDKYGSRLVMAGGSHRFPIEKQFNFCPVCGAFRVEIMEGRQEENGEEVKA